MPTVTQNKRYGELLAEHLPEAIGSAEEHERFLNTIREFSARGRKLSHAETRLCKLLIALASAWEKEHVGGGAAGFTAKGAATPAERLRDVLESSGKTAVDLYPVFGGQSHTSEALRGKRPISAEQARKLGEIFSLQPGYFV